MNITDNRHRWTCRGMYRDKRLQVGVWHSRRWWHRVLRWVLGCARTERAREVFGVYEAEV